MIECFTEKNKEESIDIQKNQIDLSDDYIDDEEVEIKLAKVLQHVSKLDIPHTLKKKCNYEYTEFIQKEVKIKKELLTFIKSVF